MNRLNKRNKSLNYELSEESKAIYNEVKQFKNIKMNLENKIQELESVIFLMENSRSWKITKPARKVGAVLRKIKKVFTLLPIAVKKKGMAPYFRGKVCL